MPQTIWKYPIKFRNDGSAVLSMPPNAEILTVQIQGTEPTVWVLVTTPDYPFVNRYFRVVGTGGNIEPMMGKRFHYVGTYQQNMLVWHLFEVKEY